MHEYKSQHLQRSSLKKWINTQTELQVGIPAELQHSPFVFLTNQCLSFKVKTNFILYGGGGEKESFQDCWKLKKKKNTVKHFFVLSYDCVLNRMFPHEILLFFHLLFNEFWSQKKSSFLQSYYHCRVKSGKYEAFFPWRHRGGTWRRYRVADERDYDYAGVLQTTGGLRRNSTKFLNYNRVWTQR